MKSITFRNQLVLAAILNVSSLLILGVILFIYELSWFSLILLGYLSIASIIFFLVYFKINKIFIKLNEVISVSDSISNGEILTNSYVEIEASEFNSISISCDKINTNNKDLVVLANEIGNKNFDVDYVLKSEKDQLGKAMVAMKASLKELALKDEQQNWIALGLAKFGEILRQENESLEKFSFSIVSNLCRYLNVNQGGLFVYNESAEETSLELMASFAYDKQKFVDKKIVLNKKAGRYVFGEGLIGQAFIDKTSIFMTDVPDDFIKITSGLGDATPKNVLVVPLQYNDEVVGVIELASFAKLKQFEIDFVQKLCEQIGSTIVTEQINSKTRLLLQDSQHQAEELVVKEAAMKKGYEEIAAIQEEIRRKESEFNRLIKEIEVESREKAQELEDQKQELIKEQIRSTRREKQVSGVLNGTEAVLFMTSEFGKIIIANEATSFLTGFSVEELPGLDYKEFLNVEKFRMGKPTRFEVTHKNGSKVMCEIVVNKIGIEDGKANLFYIVDITQLVKKENKFIDKIAELEAEIELLKNPN